MENDVRRIKLDTLTVLCITIVTFIFILIFAVFSHSNGAIAGSASMDYRVVVDSLTALVLCDILALRYGTDWLGE